MEVCGGAVWVIQQYQWLAGAETQGEIGSVKSDVR